MRSEFRRSLGIRVLAAALLLAGSLGTTPVPAQTILFQDDFGPGTLGAWTPSPLGLFGNWSTSPGSASYNGGGHTQIYAGDPAWTDYKVETRFKVTQAQNYPGGIRGRVNPANGRSYAAWIYPGDNRIKLFRTAAWHVDTPGLAVLADVPVATLTPGVFHTLSLTFQGSQISVGYDGTNVIQVTDSGVGALAAGAVALDVSNQPIEFDDVTVTTPAVASTLFFGDDFSNLSLTGWTASPLGLSGNWSNTAGAAAYNGGGHTQLYAGNTTWTDYQVSAKVRVANGQNYPGGLRGRVDTTDGRSYAAWIYPGTGRIRLYRTAAWHIDDPGFVLLADVGVGTIAPNVFHDLALAFQGNRISVLFNGAEVIQVVDSSAGALSTGAVALDVSNQPIEFDDVAVGTVPVLARTLWTDDFDPATLDGPWLPSPLGLLAGWSTAAGTAAYDGGGHTQVWAGRSTWADYRVEADFQVFASQNFPGGLRGRVNPVTGLSYAAWVYPADGRIRLYRAAAWNIDDPGSAILQEANGLTIAPNVFHQLALVFEGTQIKVIYDGVEVISVNDTATGAPAAGAIALDVSNRAIEFDNVVVTSLTGGPNDDGFGNGPGGPILVVTNVAANPYTRYLAEILLAEGFHQFTTADAATLTSNLLAGYDVVLLGETALTAGQVTLLTDWVNAGGNLIAMRPDAQLASLLGITPAGSGPLAEGYLLIDTSAGTPGQGLVGQTIQYHGAADRYTLSGAAAVATLYSNATTATANPAVTLRSVGSSGGQAATFSYDLARSVVQTRQGNPAWAGQERDGVSPIRSNDLFFGNAAFDPRPDWIDLDKVAIPQADEQQRLLANLILRMNLDRKPLPRFWYFPRMEKAVVLMTGDDHANNGTTGRFQQYDLVSPAGCSVADWECVRGSSYVYPNTPMNPADVLAFQADGFEIALHVNTGCADWTPASLDGIYATQLAALAASFPGIDAPTTNRTHCIAWSDYVSQAQVSKQYGIRLDTNYYYWPGSWIANRPGFMTGSGLLMRFADASGVRVDVYQAATQMTDESGQSFPFTIDTLLDKALGTEEYYGVFTANMHTDSPGSSGSDAIVASAQTRGVPVVSARQMLTWLDGRNGSSFGSIAWSGNTLTFTVTAATGANGLRALLPLTTPAGTLTSLNFNGNPLAFTTETIKGIAYAIFPAASGSYSAVYVP